MTEIFLLMVVLAIIGCVVAVKAFGIAAVLTCLGLYAFVSLFVFGFMLRKDDGRFRDEVGGCAFVAFIWPLSLPAIAGFALAGVVKARRNASSGPAQGR